ncbi:uncharacterized protein PHALS_11792 [Plasmopara halstedii]|uniref:Uncharacterized protein n=1 Tax=Plasmopara halstedii TaxID=4781 RepID=A0A0P1AK05_PLAHL|nr:uncharacterized protein PHALS_11792 [Plasmopara halstedii]CEG41445.1 hypothetical protein PHALS_11792 [Plasmopara halstedii]|eukprot:XP_024577814.1 hypothetical protein PHALS_11792 [Plasmopara halstedii]
MSFNEMEHEADFCLSTSTSQWVAPPAISWTREEISMIQEMFLSDEKGIRIREISISDSKQSETESPLAVSVDQSTNATSMLLSPIDADNALLRNSTMSEKDDMANYFVDRILPVNSEVSVPSSVSISSNGRSIEHMLSKLRAKVEDLSHIYYSRCSKYSGGDERNTKKVKLSFAIKRLKRVIQGLSMENDRLKRYTKSSHCEISRLHSRCSWLEIKQLSQYISKATCAAAVKDGIDLALNYVMNGRVLMDRHDELGWDYKSFLTQHGAFSFKLKKDYPKEVNMHGVIKKTLAIVTDSENVSRVKHSFIRVQQVTKLDQDVVIVYDMPNYSAPRMDRVVAVLFRAETPTGFLLGLRSLNVDNHSDTERRMDCTVWQRYNRKQDGGFSVTAGGVMTLPSRAGVNLMAVEVYCLHWRWESSVIGTQWAI